VSRSAIPQGSVVDPAVVRRAQPERDFQRSVCELLDLRGWLWWHDVDSRKNKRGLPDLIAVRGRRLIFAELKSAKGTVTDDQLSWLYRLGGLESTEVEVYVWRPGQMDEIERVLR
jgi:hypothetical protein